MPALSEWLQLMLAEIARKHEELERARAEQRARELDPVTGPATPGSEPENPTGH